MVYEDPLEWDRQVQNSHPLVEQYRRQLRVDPVAADPQGPFVGTPFITTRAAFNRIRELPEELPLREPLLRWAFRLADARVNAELEQQRAIAWRTEVLRIDHPGPLETTRAALLARVLSDGSARHVWLDLLAKRLDGWAELTSLHWQRRHELAQRAGFDGAAGATDPVPGFEQRVSEWQRMIKPLKEHAWECNPMSVLAAGLASDATQGWPARLNAQSVAALLGGRDWLSRTVREPQWPRLIGPSSFMRAIHALGCELARAWAASTHPFAIAHRAGGGSQQRLGYLLASLVTNPEWQRRVLRLRPEQARAQARMLAIALLYAAQLLYLKVRLSRAAADSSRALVHAHAQYSLEAFGFEPPRAFAGQLPRLDLDDAHALVGFWAGLSDHARLREAHDIDWFRNPRAIEAVLEQSGAIEPATLDSKVIEAQQNAAARWLFECLNE